jgi:hypothetical protein
MRTAIATLITLLILNLADEYFNNARYTSAAATMLSHIVRSFG